MNPMQSKVREFHQLFAVDAPALPVMPSEQIRKLRESLICEELSEFCDANQAGDLTAAADAIGDMLYVVLGAAVAYGIDIEQVFNEIHRSNMSKAWTADEAPEVLKSGFTRQVDGNGMHVIKRADGKVVKPPSYSPANVAGVLLRLKTVPAAPQGGGDLFGGISSGGKPGHAH